LEVRVEFLLENPPCKEGQPPDILLKSALRAKKKTQNPCFFSAKRSSSSLSEKAGSFFSTILILQISASFEVRQAARRRASSRREDPRISSEFFFEDESCAAPARFVFHVVEHLANDVHSNTAGPDIFEISAAYALGIA
jgi:hypothetical protein